jgi:hypothetical protein
MTVGIKVTSRLEADGDKGGAVQSVSMVNGDGNG